MSSHDKVLRRYIAKAARDNIDAVQDLVEAVRVRAWLDRAALVDSSDRGEMLIGYTREVCRAWVYRARHELRLDERGGADRESIAVGRLLASPARGSMSVKVAVERRAWLERVLSRLTDNPHVVVNFKVCWDMPTSLIAELLGISEATVRVHLFHGLKKLRTIIAEDPYPEGDESDDN